MRIASKGRQKQMTAIVKRKHRPSSSADQISLRSDESIRSISISPSLRDDHTYCALYSAETFINDVRNINTFQDSNRTLHAKPTNEDRDLHQAANILFHMRQTPPPPPLAMTLALPEDKDHLNSLHCFVRRYLLELVVIPDCCVRQTVCYDRVGLQCVYCAHTPKNERDSGAAFFPRSVDDIYRMVCNWQRTHFQSCQHVPDDVKARYWKLKTQDKSRGKVPYWTNSARKLGLANYVEIEPSLVGNSSTKRKISPGTTDDVDDLEEDKTNTGRSKSLRVGIILVKSAV
jgi:hypothetical protein